MSVTSSPRIITLTAVGTMLVVFLLLAFLPVTILGILAPPLHL